VQSGQYAELQLSAVPHEAQVSAVPVQKPVPASAPQPGQVHPEHVAQLALLGMPVQLVTCRVTGAGGWSFVVRQQIGLEVPEQSLSELQVCGQVFAQAPLQQRGVVGVDAQSDDCVQALGHEAVAGLMQMPPLPRFGSIRLPVMQQISPPAVLHIESLVQEAGHALAAVQMGFA
jgi:hypothetical protein